MMDAEETQRSADPWHPITDKVDLKILGKLQEELGELQSAIARCIVQGVDAVHPVTGKPNREWMREEISDVLAGVDIAVERFHHDQRKPLNERRYAKREYMARWHRHA